MEGIFGIFACLGVVLVLLVILGIVLGVRGRRRERERQQALQAWAVANRWAYVRSPAVDWGQRLPGRNRRGVSLSLSGHLWGRRVSVAEYSYTTESSSTDASGNTTSSSTVHHFVVSAIHLDRPWPELSVTPRSGLSKLGKAMFNTGSAVGHHEFDRQFAVTGDPASLPPALVAAHLAGQVPVWSVYGADLLTWQPGRITDPTRIPDLAAPLFPVAEMLTGPANRTSSDSAAPR